MEKLIHLSEKYLVPPTYIELEITESAFFDYKEDLQTKLYALKDKGFKLFIDKIFKRPETIIEIRVFGLLIFLTVLCLWYIEVPVPLLQSLHNS